MLVFADASEPDTIAENGTKVKHAMDTFSHIYGHNRQILGLNRMLATGKVPGVFVFSGPEHIGKATIARAFAAALLGVAPDDLAQHPDWILCVPTRKDTGAKVYELDDVRALIGRLAQSAILGKTVVCIDDADLLTRSAQNALLKTLEEPSGNTVVILIAHDAAQILPTVQSRAVCIPFIGEISESSEPTRTIAIALCAPSLVARLVAAQGAAKQEDLDVDVLLAVVHRTLRESGRDSARTLDALLAVRERFAANGNRALALEQFALALP